MKGTDHFKRTIQMYLEQRAEEDTLFAKKYRNPAKNIDECVTHILNYVQKSGCSGFTDGEIFGQAIHYYEENEIEVGKPMNCQVVVNHVVELTEEEKAEARQNAARRYQEEDWNRFLSVVQTDKEGNRLNIIKVDGVDSADEKVIGKRLQEIAKNATTGGLYTQVGELYGFPIKVVSERILKEGLEFTDNRFVVEGNYKYTYNNGHLAMADPLAAARNFLNAMERIPSIIDQYKAKNEVLEMEIPQLQEIAGKVWKKEDELKQLKSELAALDRKIQLELAPPTPEVAEKENEGQQLKPEAEDVRNRQAQYPENAPPQIRSPADSIVANHVIIGRPGLYAKEETRSKGLKI